jgi:hypothetical protein
MMADGFAIVPLSVSTSPKAPSKCLHNVYENSGSTDVSNLCSTHSKKA